MSEFTKLLIIIVAGLVVGGYISYTNRPFLKEKSGIVVSLAVCFVGLLLVLAGGIPPMLRGAKTEIEVLLLNSGIFVVCVGAVMSFVASSKEEEPEPEPEPVVLKEEPKPETPPLALPEHLRTSHHLILGGSGAGKSQLLQQLIAEDITKARTVIVMDSHGDMINKIANLDSIARGRIVLIDPADVEYPIALNPWYVHPRVNSMSLLEREKHINGVIEFLSYILSALGAEFTSKQETIFQFTNRLMLEIPDATIHTLRELLSRGGYDKYAKYTKNLNATSQAFFKDQFNSKPFEETKEQVLRRIYALLANSTFDRMFSSPVSKLDLFEEMQDGNKVILINTSLDLLKNEGSAFFSRVMVSLIIQAIQERASVHERDRVPTFFYIDEAAPVLSPIVMTALETCRKYNLGMILAFQSLGQIPAELQHSVITNTAIKMTSGISGKDARALAPDMHTDADRLLAQSKLWFNCYWKNIERVFDGEQYVNRDFRVVAGLIESMPKRNDMRELQKMTRDKYAVHISELQKKKEDDSVDDIEQHNRT